MLLSKTFHSLLLESTQNRLTIQSFLNALGDKGHAALMMLFVLPFLQPIPTFGLSAPFGISIGLIGTWMMIGKKPWLPNKICRLEIPDNLAKNCFSTAETIFNKLEKIFKPRQTWLIQSTFFHAFSGFLLMINGFLLALPLPIPFSNAAPAWTILIICLALVEEDGLALTFGYACSVLTCVFLSSIIGGFFWGLLQFVS